MKRWPWRLADRRASFSFISVGWRFMLLAAVVAVSSVEMFDRVLAPKPDDTPGDALGCMLAAGMDPDGYHVDNLRALTRYPEAMAECLRGVPAVPYWKGMVATLGLFAAAALLYWWLPHWRDRQGSRTLPVEAVDADGSLSVELAELCSLTATEKRVRFRVDPTRTTGGAVAYGRAGRYTVMLHGGLLARRGADPDSFRAVVLHELAHIHNRDVGYAYGGLALWRAFTVLAFLPAMFSAGRLTFLGLTGNASSPFWPGTAPTLVRGLSEGLLLVLLVHLARADLLRQRELDADARAIGWGAVPSAWNHSDSDVGAAPALRRLSRVLSTHPSWAQRRAVLVDPGRPRQVGALGMLLTGLASWLLVNQLFVVPGMSTGSSSAWVIVALVAPVLWIAVRQSAETARGKGRLAIPGAGAGLWLGLGLSIGELLRGPGGTEWLVYNPVYLLFFLMVGTVPAVWLAQSDRLAALLSRPGQRGAVRLLSGAVALVLLWEALRWWLSVGRTHLAGPADRLYQATDSVQGEFAWEDSAIARFEFNAEFASANPVLAVAVLSMWLLPLLLSLTGAGIARPRTTMLAGMAGTMLSWAAISAALLILTGRRSGEVEFSVNAAVAMHWWLLAATAAACLITAGAVAALTREHC